MAQGLEKYKEDFFLLLEAGFIAIKNADEDSAIKLFRACKILDPQHSFPTIGLGYMHFCKLELKQATHLLNSVLEKEPDNELAKALLGLTLSFNPNETMKGEKILTETCKTTQDEEIKKLGDLTLAFVDEHIKKSPSPVEIQPPKKKQTDNKSKDMRRR